MGEAHHLSHEERVSLIRAARRVLDSAEPSLADVPIIAGTGAGSTRETIQLTKESTVTIARTPSGEDVGWRPTTGRLLLRSKYDSELRLSTAIFCSDLIRLSAYSRLAGLVGEESR